MADSIILASRALTIRPDLGLLVVRWHTEAAEEVVHAEYWQTLDVAVAHGLSHWLLDVRRRQKAPLQLSTWVNNTFYPEAVARLAPRRLRMAVLSTPLLTQQYHNDPAQYREVTYALDPARPFDLGMFEDEGQAMSWLRPGQER